MKGPFIPLLRSPRLLAPLQKAGEYLRFDSALSRRVSEFATLVVARQWTQQFEWFTHVPLARQEGTSAETIEALAGRTPAVDDERRRGVRLRLRRGADDHRGVSDATYRECVERFGERGVIDLVGLIGYFALVSMVLNVAHTPPNEVPGVAALPAVAEAGGSPRICHRRWRDRSPRCTVAGMTSRPKVISAPRR